MGILPIVWLTYGCIAVRKDSETLTVVALYSLLSVGLIIICTYSLIVERDLSYLVVIVLSMVILFQNGPKMVTGIRELFFIRVSKVRQA